MATEMNWKIVSDEVSCHLSDNIELQQCSYSSYWSNSCGNEHPKSWTEWPTVISYSMFQPECGKCLHQQLITFIQN